MSYKPDYTAGDWKALCDRCGFKFKASQLYKTWDNLRVCKVNDCWEPRHPQDFVRGVKDDQSVPWTRSEPADVEVDKSGWVTPSTVPEGTFDNDF